jgi:hypothetical protein
VQLTKTELVARREDINDDDWFVDDCVFGRCGPAAQQASETVIGRLGKTERWDHEQIADQILKEL